MLKICDISIRLVQWCQDLSPGLRLNILKIYTYLILLFRAQGNAASRAIYIPFMLNRSRVGLSRNHTDRPHADDLTPTVAVGF